MARFVIDTAEMGIDETTESRLFVQLQRVVLDHAVEPGVEKPWVCGIARPEHRSDDVQIGRILSRLN